MINIHANVVLHFILYAVPKLSGKKTVWKHCIGVSQSLLVFWESKFWLVSKPTDMDWIYNFATQLAVTCVKYTCHLEDFCQQSITWNSQEWLLLLKKLWPDEQIGMGFVSALHYCYAAFLMDQKSSAGPAVTEVILVLSSLVKINLLFSSCRFICRKPFLLWKNQIFRVYGERIGKVEICEENTLCRWRPVLWTAFLNRTVFC